MFVVAACVCVWAVVLVPGVVLGLASARGVRPHARVAIGLNAALAGCIYLCYHAIVFIGLSRAVCGVWMAAAAVILTVGAWQLQRAWTADPLLLRRRTAELLPVAAIAGGGALLRGIGLAGSTLPPGYDPTNHLLLAKLIAVRGSLPPTWIPFEPVLVSYPPGVHTLLATLHVGTGLPLVVLWKSLSPVTGMLTVWSVYSIARCCVPESRATALWAASAVAFLAWNGALGDYAWGGLVNQTAVTLAVALLMLCLEYGPAVTGCRQWPVVILGGLFWAGVFICHHHVTLSYGVVFCIGGALLFIRRRTAGLHTLVFLSLLASLFLGVRFWVPYVCTALTATNTYAFTFVEPFFWPHKLFATVGPVMFVATVAGLCRWRRLNAGPAPLLVLAGILVLLSLFFGLQYGVQGIYYLLYHQPFTPLAPSRFLTNCMPLLALPAGLALGRLSAALEKRRAGLGLAVALVVALQAGMNGRRLAQCRASDDEYRACLWVRDNTPANAYIINWYTSNWVCFVAWREALVTPLSGSQSLPQDKQARHLANLRSDRPVYYIGDLPDQAPVYPSGRYSVYRIK